MAVYPNVRSGSAANDPALTTDVSVVAEQHSRVDGEQDLLAVAVCIEEKGDLIHLPLTKTISDYTPCRTKAQEPFWDRKNRRRADALRQ